MRVLHVQKVKGIGGSERHLLSLLPALQQRGMEVSMLALGASESRRFVTAMQELGIEAASVPAGPDLNPLLCRRLAKAFMAKQPDVVHTHLIHADLHGQVAARAARVPGVSSVHGAHGFYRREPYRSAARLAGHLARETIAISDHVAELLRDAKLVPPGRIRVVPYGIDASRWVAGTKERRAARDRLGLDDETVVVGIASRLIPHKGHDFLIQGLAEARLRRPELHLLVAGDGPCRAELERLAADVLGQGGARFLGFVEDVAGFMHACDVLAFPTMPRLSEGFGLAALEAMGAGRPVVATAVGSLPEIVVPGETGMVVTPGAVGELADALVTLAADGSLRARLGEQGRRRAVTAFSLDAMVDGTVAAYEAVT